MRTEITALPAEIFLVIDRIYFIFFKWPKRIKSFRS